MDEGKSDHNTDEKTENPVVQLHPEGAEETPDPPEQAQQQFVYDFQVPFGFEIWSGGLYQIVKFDEGEGPPPIPGMDRVCPTARRACLKNVATKPVWIRQFGRDMSTHQDLVEIGFRDIRYDADTYIWVERSVIADTRTIVKLSARGLPVTSGNAPKIVYYLDKAIARNARRLDWADVARRMGAVETSKGWGWLLGKDWVGPPGSNVVPDPTLGNNFTRGYGTGGDQQEWLDKFEQIASVNPIARWLCYATFAGPLLRHVNRRTFCIHHWGTSGKGKSALAKFGQSAWGDPHMLTETFDRTEKSFTEMFSLSSDFPLLFDELQSSDLENPSKLIYALTGEKGRGRAKQTGGLEESLDEWKSVIRFTGEENIVGKGSVDKGGESNRVVQFAASALTSLQAGALHRWCDKGHRGWGGKMFLEGLRNVIGSPGSRAALKQKYAEYAKKLNQQRYRILGDRVGHLAVVALAQTLASHWLYGADLKHARNQSLSDAIYIAELLLEDAEQTPTTAEAALQLLRDNADSNAHEWLDLSQDDHVDMIEHRRWSRLTGIIHPDRNEVWILQKPANFLLRREGLAPRAVWRELREKGLLVVRDTRSLAVVRTRGAFRNRVYVLRWDKFRPELDT